MTNIAATSELLAKASPAKPVVKSMPTANLGQVRDAMVAIADISKVAESMVNLNRRPGTKMYGVPCIGFNEMLDDARVAGELAEVFDKLPDEYKNMVIMQNNARHKFMTRQYNIDTILSVVTTVMQCTVSIATAYFIIYNIKNGQFKIGDGE